jgi:hypothetical protein
MKFLLPNSEEARKLLFETWKYLLLGFLGLLALMITPTRHWLLGLFDDLAKYSESHHGISGRVLLPLWVAAAFTTACILYFIVRFIGPKYLRAFTQGEYNGAIWRWRWKRRRVLKDSLHALCTRCGTELRIDLRYTQFERPDTHLYCTTCNQADVITNCKDLPDHIWRKIEVDVRTNTWKAAIERIPQKYRA